MADATDGYVRMNVDKVLVSERGGVVLLVTDQDPFVGKVVPVFVDSGQAVNIQLALTHDLAPRPFTHDLLTTILNELGAIVMELTIDELAQNTFFSTLKIEMEKQGETRVEAFDARPSDGIALALRANAPIRVATKVMEQAAVEPEEFFGSLEGGQ